MWRSGQSLIVEWTSVACTRVRASFAESEHGRDGGQGARGFYQSARARECLVSLSREDGLRKYCVGLFFCQRERQEAMGVDERAHRMARR